METEDKRGRLTKQVACSKKGRVEVKVERHYQHELVIISFPS